MLDDVRSSSSTILVVDDNEANRSLAKETLEDEGFRVVLASGGAEGLRAFEAEKPDCVVLDVRMPDMDGFAVCTAIRALQLGRTVPILFLTALRDVDTFDRAQRAGADDFVTKPVRPAELVVRVQTALKMQRLGHELRAHYDLIRRQRDDLIRLQLQKERLTAFVVHDLKNPVNAIDLHAQVLQRMRETPEEAKSSIGEIRSETRHLNRMILNLLDLSKADEAKLTPKRAKVDAGALVRDVLRELDVSAKAHGVALGSSVDAIELHADEDLVRRLVANLVDNAVRHAPPRSDVHVHVTHSDAGVEIRVRDAGPGIPSERRDGVFDAFVQLEDAEGLRARAGRGLGLTFCKVVAEAHGGAIWVEDAAPGAVFCVRFPHVE